MALVDHCNRSLAGLLWVVDLLVAFQAGKMAVQDCWGSGSGAKVVGAVYSPWEAGTSTAVAEAALAVVELELEEHGIAFLRIVEAVEEVVVVELENYYQDKATEEAVLQGMAKVGAVLLQDMGMVEVGAVESSGD